MSGDAIALNCGWLLRIEHGNVARAGLTMLASTISSGMTSKICGNSWSRERSSTIR
jgi:hypothetical protein